MISEIENRSAIKLLVLQDKNYQEIVVQLQSTYKLDAPSLTTIKYWIREFKSGRTSVFDDERQGRSQEISDSVDEKLSQIVQEERRITTNLLSTRLNVSV